MYGQSFRHLAKESYRDPSITPISDTIWIYIFMFIFYFFLSQMYTATAIEV